MQFPKQHLSLNHLSTIAPLLLLLAAPLPALAQTKKLVSAGCRQGRCWETYVVGKQVIRQDELDGTPRTVYVVDLEGKTPRKGDQWQNWVQCSTQEPFVAFIPLPMNADQVVLHYLNPGGEVYGYNTTSHLMYWAICHDIWKPNLSKMTGKAKSLGYSLKLKTDQRDMPKDSFNP